MMPAPLNVVTLDHVRRARRLLAQGWSLREVANHLNISASDLDVALWQCIRERI